MKALWTAILETIVLFAAIGLTFILAVILKYDNPYNDFRKNNPDTVVTVASAAGMTADGSLVTQADVSQQLGIANAPDFVVDFLNQEVGMFKAKVLNVYTFVAVISGLLCLIFGVGFPFAMFRRGVSPGQYFRELLVNENLVYVDRYGMEYGNVGEKRAFLLTVVSWTAMLALAVAWGFLLPLFIPLNLAFAVLLVLLQIVLSLLSNSTKKLTSKIGLFGKKGKEKYNILVHYGFYVVAGTKNSDRMLYFNKFENALAVYYIMQCEEQGRTFNRDDATKAIRYDHEKLHMRLIIAGLTQGLVQLIIKKLSQEEQKLHVAVDQRKYRFGITTSSGDSKGCIIKYNDYDSYMPFRKNENYAFAVYVMHLDSEKKILDADSWNKWAKLTASEKQKYMPNERIDVPKADSWWRS